MRNSVQRYAWGSKRALVELYGFSNEDDEPMAELWMGAHPKAPSVVETSDGEQTVAALIDHDPAAALGAQVVDRFGPRLPFLFKVLCAGEPLSIQAHPSLDQARDGFAREEAAGPARDAPNRNYRDDNHKPELICALRPFWGLRGFRSPEAIAAEFASDSFDSLTPPHGEGDISRFFADLLRLAPDERARCVAAALARASAAWPEYNAESPPEPGDPNARYFWVRRIAEVHQGDIGTLSPLILNTFSLVPGQAIYQPAGVLHAYLSGVGVELMANSDNVLRGGMTVKHIDVDELLRVGVFSADEPAHTLPVASTLFPDAGDDAVAYPTPFQEFELHSLSAPKGPVTANPQGPLVVFCHTGALVVGDSEATVALSPGRSCFVPASATDVRISGPGLAYVAAVPA